ncbi:hypothetical protein HPB50_016300 [Hyalomma asiaticum]|uniref:Uncharacterized protein n=1 Tax=Hyalomma asiaticum TaxID=266040 RepID=A0ACB7T375_HYAAI|nr:hypothetical protein HPB50_016300 [Hyalomma asiaticum]
MCPVSFRHRLSCRFSSYTFKRRRNAAHGRQSPYGTPSPASYSLVAALDKTLITDSCVVNKRSPDERDYSQGTGVVFGVVSVVTSEYMWMPRALVVVCVIALIIVSCLVGLYVAGILRRRGMLPRGDRNVLGLGTGCPGGYEPGCQQVAIGTPVAYYSAAPTWQYPAPNTYGAQQGYSGQPWAAQQHGYPAYPYTQGTVPKQVGPLYPV